jgi:hypothetical protein
MNHIHKKIWQLSLPYLKMGIRKDLVLHTKMVVKAMRILLKNEKGDSSILITAAIVHDTGWSKVPYSLQRAVDKNTAKQAMLLHLKYCTPIIKRILTTVNFDRHIIKDVISIVLSHKFKNPRTLEKRLLIDADTLSDVFKKPFYADARMFNLLPQELYGIRSKNKFYTETAKIVFEKELKKRAQEIGISDKKFSQEVELSSYSRPLLGEEESIPLFKKSRCI